MGLAHVHLKLHIRTPSFSARIQETSAFNLICKPAQASAVIFYYLVKPICLHYSYRYDNRWNGNGRNWNSRHRHMRPVLRRHSCGNRSPARAKVLSLFGLRLSRANPRSYRSEVGDSNRAEIPYRRLLDPRPLSVYL